MSEDAILWRVKHGHLSGPVDGMFSRAVALAELAAKPKQKGGRRAGGSRKGPAAADDSRSADAEVRYRLARAYREEHMVGRLRGDFLEKRPTLRIIEAWIQECGEALDEVPRAEADAIADALAEDPTPARAKRELERIVRAFKMRLSARALAMAKELQ